MASPLFNDVREAISKWIKSNDENFSNKNILLEILKDDERCLRAELNFGEALAEILVVEPDFVPFRYVSFQAVGILSTVPDLVHFWYDKEDTSIREVIENLDKAITAVWKITSK